ncbi:MAG: serine/threonine protein kinase [Deltaproteobacteria bacterium]|nr:serine/threonine protein kinase [Deltaproteobacteria bacterium]
MPELDFGPYVLLRRLAVGGMGEVHLARRRGSDEKLVVKQMLPQLADDPALVQLFLDEARIAKNLEHRGIVQIFDCGEVDGTYFIALEHVDGLDLAQLLLALRPDGLGERFATRVAIDVARALHFSHEARDGTGAPLEIIHRDISPHNVLLSKEGTVHLTDFGIARARIRAARTTTGVLRGKLAYVAPERFQGGEGDRRVDIWALGVVAYEAISGARPFDGEPLAIIDGVVRQRIPKLKDTFAGISPKLSEVVARAMARSVEERFLTAEAFANALEDLRIAAEPAELAELVSRETDRRKLHSDQRRRTQTIDLEDTESLDRPLRGATPRVVSQPPAPRPRRAAELADDEVTAAADPSERRGEGPEIVLDVSPLDVLAADEIGPPTALESYDLAGIAIDGTPLGAAPEPRPRAPMVAEKAPSFSDLTPFEASRGAQAQQRKRLGLAVAAVIAGLLLIFVALALKPSAGEALPSADARAVEPPANVEDTLEAPTATSAAPMVPVPALVPTPVVEKAEREPKRAKAKSTKGKKKKVKKKDKRRP